MMASASLQAIHGDTIAVSSPFKIGRDEGASLTLADEDASREHALLSRDPADGGWWLTDLQSTNGTYVNGRRIRAATRITDGDRIRIGNGQWYFRSNASRGTSHPPNEARTRTVQDEMECWLLLADLVASSRLIQSLGHHDYMQQLSDWLKRMEDIIRASGGFINESTGDGFLAVWDARRQPIDRLLRGLDDLLAAQAGSPAHRCLLHLGMVLVGGAGPSSGLEPINGSPLNLLFKAERALPDRAPGIFLSDAAIQGLGDHDLRLQPLNGLDIPGFEPSLWFRAGH